MERQDIENLVDARVQKYFDHYLAKTLPTILEQQVKTCPHGRKISKITWAIVGGATVLAIISPTVGVQIAKFFTSL